MITDIQWKKATLDISQQIGLMTYLAKRGLIDPELGVLSVQARLLTEHCIKLTPPRDEAQGKGAVLRDLNYIIKGRDQSYLEFVVQLTGKTTNVEQVLRRKDGTPYVIDVNIIDLNGSQVPGFHKGQRDSRGRIPMASSKRQTRDIGRHTQRNVLWTTNEVFTEYKRRIMNRVGWAKAGWLYAYQALGGQRLSDGWIRRHSAHRGTLTDGRNDPQRPFIDVRNTSGWGKSPLGDRVVFNSMQSRLVSMDRYFQRHMDYAREGKITKWQSQMRAVANAERAIPT